MKHKVKAVLVIILILLILNSTYIYAASNTSSNIVWNMMQSHSANPDLKNTADKWISLGKRESQSTTNKWTGFNSLIGIIWGAGIFVVLICGVILGIKYMISSVEEKASMKENLKPYIIGTVMIMGALTIWRVLVELLNGI